MLSAGFLTLQLHRRTIAAEMHMQMKAWRERGSTLSILHRTNAIAMAPTTIHLWGNGPFLSGPSGGRPFWLSAPPFCDTELPVALLVASSALATSSSAAASKPERALYMVEP